MKVWGHIISAVEEPAWFSAPAKRAKATHCASFAANRHSYGRPMCGAAARDRRRPCTRSGPAHRRRGVLLVHDKILAVGGAHGLLDVFAHGGGVHDDGGARRCWSGRRACSYRGWTTDSTNMRCRAPPVQVGGAARREGCCCGTCTASRCQDAFGLPHGSSVAVDTVTIASFAAIRRRSAGRHMNVHTCRAYVSIRPAVLLHIVIARPSTIV